MVRKIVFLLFVFALNNHVFGGILPGVEIDTTYTPFSGNVYLISIGVDHYTKINGKSKNIELRYAQSDAINFERFLEKDTLIKKLNKFSFRDNANKKGIIDAFKEIAKKANQSDLFIIYYSGMSTNGSILLRDDSLSSIEIFNLTQDIFCERQLMFIDCNNGDIFLKGLKKEIKKKPEEKINTKIDRVLFYTSNVAYEGVKIKCDTSYNGGLFTGGFISSGYHVTDFFKGERSDHFITNLKAKLYDCMQFGDRVNIGIFSERDFINDYIETKNENRGESSQTIEKKIIEKITIKKGETLCIILGNQNFDNPNLELKNVKNDVNKIQDIFNNDYYTTSVLLTDINYQKFIDTLNYFHSNYRFEEGSQILFYAASHGFKDQFGIAYLVFTDTKRDNLDLTAMPLQNLKRKITGFGATNTLMLMDICHSGLAFESDICNEPSKEPIPLNSQIFTKKFNENSPAFYNYLSLPSNLYFSSSRDQEAADGTGDNSPFATVVIKFLEDNNLPVIDSYYLQERINKDAFKYGAISFPKFCSYNCEVLPEARFLFIQK